MADKADDRLPMDRFDADFHGASDIAVSPDNYTPLRNLTDIERMERVPFEARARPLSSFALLFGHEGNDPERRSVRRQALVCARPYHRTRRQSSGYLIHGRPAANRYRQNL